MFRKKTEHGHPIKRIQTSGQLSVGRDLKDRLVSVEPARGGVFLRLLTEAGEMEEDSVDKDDPDYEIFDKPSEFLEAYREAVEAGREPPPMPTGFRFGSVSSEEPAVDENGKMYWITLPSEDAEPVEGAPTDKDAPAVQSPS